MSYPEKTERNVAVVADYLTGATIPAVAALHGISPTRARVILKRAGCLRGPEAVLKMRQAQVIRPDIRARISATMREHWANGHWPNGRPAGRPMLFADDPDRRGDYLRLREACGADHARRAMGLCA